MVPNQHLPRRRQCIYQTKHCSQSISRWTNVLKVMLASKASNVYYSSAQYVWCSCTRSGPVTYRKPIHHPSVTPRRNPSVVKRIPFGPHSSTKRLRLMNNTAFPFPLKQRTANLRRSR